jgi:hypothetical protein
MKSPHNSFHRFPRAENLLEKSKYAHIFSIFYHKTIDLSYITLRQARENEKEIRRLKMLMTFFFPCFSVAPILPTFLRQHTNLYHNLVFNAKKKRKMELFNPTLPYQTPGGVFAKHEGNFVIKIYATKISDKSTKLNLPR